jgi:hypothetical protein
LSENVAAAMKQTQEQYKNRMVEAIEEKESKFFEEMKAQKQYEQVRCLQGSMIR